MEKFLHLLLFLHPFILPASGCIGVGSGCRRSGLIFGGRLMLSGNNGMNFGNLPEINGNRVFIFQTPPQMRTFLRPSAGRGQIWIGRSSCAGTVPGHCPSSEKPPCLDSGPCPPIGTPTPPCSIALNVNEKDVLTFTWERPTCVPENEDLTYSYTFWMDGNTETGTTTDTQKTFPDFYYNSKYFFEVNVNTSEGFYSDYISNASPAYADSTPLTFLAVSTSGVTVSWPFWSETTDKGLGPIAEYIIQYRLKGDSEFERFPRGLTNQYRFEGLTSGATYEFQVIIVKSNPTEEGDPSAIQEVQINCPAPTGTSLSLRSDYRSSDNSVAIYASWSVGISPFCTAGLDQTLTVQVLNQDSCNDTSSLMIFDEIYIMGGEIRDYTLRNTPSVLPNSLYRVTITVGNTLTVDNTQTIQTADAVPTQPPELSNVMAIPPQITFNWNPPPCGGRNGVITNYECRYRVWREGSTQPEEETRVTSNRMITFNDYDPNSRYTFSVRALTAVGAGTTDTFAVIDPPRYKDDTPLTFSDVTSVSMRVSWAAWNGNVDFGQGPVDEYILCYRMKTTGADFTEVYRGSDLSYQVTGLQAGELYEFRIKLVKSDPPVEVEGPPSSIQQSISCEGLGDLTPQLATSRLHRGNVSLDVSWEIPSSACVISDQSLIIQQLDMDGCYYRGYEETTALGVTHRSHSLTGMKPNTEYNVTLQVRTAAGLFSVSEKIRTAETEPTGTPRMKEKRKVGRITFWWEPPPCGERNGVLSYYYYMVLNGNVEEGNIRKGSRLKTVMGLNEGDRYMFKVRAWTGAGDGDYTSDEMKTFYLG